MASGIGAFGIDGAGDDLDEGVEQLLLPGLHALALDAGCGCARHCLDEGDTIMAEFFQVRFVARVGVQQGEDAHGFITAVVKANTDQMDAWALQLMEYAAKIPRLVEAHRRHQTVAFAAEQFEPGGGIAPLHRMTIDAQCLWIMHDPIDDQPCGLQAASAAVEQVNHARWCLADTHGFLQDALQQGGEAGLGTEAGGDFKKACQGLLHSLHGDGQLVHFKHGRMPGQGVIEVETADGIGFLNQRAQRAHQYP
ncbi:hypothetical protein D3C80_1401410 [compost metagenome]